jgi:MFS family permease
MGFMAVFLAGSNPSLALGILLFLVALMAFAGGSIMPAWMEVIAKVIPTRLRGRFFALGGVVSGVTGVGGAALVGYFLGNFAFPYSYAYCFFAASVAMAGSFAFLSSTREQAVPSTKPVVGTGTYLRRLPGILKRDRNFATYLGVRAFGVASNMGQAFFTVYALGRLGASDEQVAAFTLAVLLSQTLTTVMFGWLADRFGHKLVLMLGLGATALGNAIALLARDPQVMYLSFAMMGAYLGALNVSHLTIALEFGPPEDRPTYIGLAGTVMSPLAFGAPLVGGLLADRVGYSVVFALALVLASTAVIGLRTLVRDPRHYSSLSSG